MNTDEFLNHDGEFLNHLVKDNDVDILHVVDDAGDGGGGGNLVPTEIDCGPENSVFNGGSLQWPGILPGIWQTLLSG